VYISCFVQLERAWIEYGSIYLTSFCCYKCVVKQWRSQNPLKDFPTCLDLSCSGNCVTKYQDGVNQLQGDVLLV